MAASREETQPLLQNDSRSQSIAEPSKSNTVDFDINGDAGDPLQWPKAFKWSVVILLTFTAFTVTFTCISVVPVANGIIEDLEGGKRKSASVLLVTIWELGEAAGPLFISPLSEISGRSLIMNICNVGFVAFTVMASLASSSSMIIAVRFLTGMCVAVNVLNPAIVGDMFPNEERGRAMSLIMLAPLLGGAIGPACSGIIATSLGWRGLLWICAGVMSVCEICFIIFFRETFKVTILKRRARQLRKETGNEDLKTVFEQEASTRRMWESVARPFAILASSLVLQALSLFGSVAFTYFYVMSTTLPDIMQEVFGLTEAQSGYAFVTFSAGSIISVVICNRFLDNIYIRLRDSHKGVDQPEYRLPLAIMGACILPFSIAFYGWATYLPLPVMLIAVVLLGATILLNVLPLMSYVVDAFGIYSASAMTTLIVTRCLMGTFLPLATQPMVDRMGYGLAFTIWGVISLGLLPIPILIYVYGRRLRERSGYTKDD